MNFLAHLYLSGDNHPLMIGNFLGDFVKGKAHEDFEADIRKGILLHRKIDQYTDDHQVVLKSKQRLRPKYRHYAPVIADVFYDHFLANLWNQYHHQPLQEYTETFYRLTRDYREIIPEKAKRLLHYMERDNWLLNYQHLDGIHRALEGLSRRTAFASGMEDAGRDLEKNYEAYQKEFEVFFPELVRYSRSVINSL